MGQAARGALVAGGANRLAGLHLDELLEDELHPGPDDCRGGRRRGWR